MTLTTSATDYAVPTGDFITEWLEENEVSQADLARRMGVSAKHVSKLISGAPLSPDVAVKLALATSIDTRIWLSYEATYRADVARLALIEELASQRELAESFPLKDLRSLGIVTNTLRNPGAVVLELFAFFGVGTVDALKNRMSSPALALRQATAHTANDAALATWWRLVELELGSEEPLTAPFSEPGLRGLLPELRSLSVQPPSHFGSEIVNRLAGVGVRLTYVREVAGARVFGATRWENGRPDIALSLRGVNDGQYWFTLFHELGHALLHPNSGVHIQSEVGMTDDAENEADAFAGNVLIPSEFESALPGLQTTQQVKAFAAMIGVSPGVVVGRLWHERLWPFDKGHGLCMRLRVVED